MTPANPATPVTDPNAVDLPAPAVDLLAEPTFEECVAEYNQYFADREAKHIRIRDVPDGHHVAYYDGKIHDHDADPTALRVRVAAALGIHPARLVVDYPWMW